MTLNFLNDIGPIAFKTLISILFTGLIGVIVWPVRKVKKEWQDVKQSLAAVHNELSVQRNNCLTTLQSQGEVQIDLLGKTVAALDGVRLDLATQTGYMAAQANKVVPRRRLKK